MIHRSGGWVPGLEVTVHAGVSGDFSPALPKVETVKADANGEIEVSGLDDPSRGWYWFAQAPKTVRGLAVHDEPAKPAPRKPAPQKPKSSKK